MMHRKLIKHKKLRTKIPLLQNQDNEVIQVRHEVLDEQETLDDTSTNYETLSSHEISKKSKKT